LSILLEHALQQFLSDHGQVLRCTVPKAHLIALDAENGDLDQLPWAVK
jgi:hypothetical protein